MDVDTEALPVRERYALMIASILPRPIAWVSTISPEGKLNLAPFSFFTGITANPMTVCFCPVDNREGHPKDTLVNVRAVKQFVVNLATEKNAPAMNQTAAPYAYGISEFEKAGLTPVPSVKVKPPRVKESPVAMECELLQVVDVGAGAAGGHVVIGKVVHFHADDDIFKDGRLRHQDLGAVGRMEGDWYARTKDAFELPRPQTAENKP